VGRTLSGELYARSDRKARDSVDKVLSVQNLSMGAMVRDTSFTSTVGRSQAYSV
jgi:simple sugar transport system ATP-binding protein